jgi:hypothetical protein
MTDADRPKKEHGGRRSNAGRPQLTDTPTVTYSITLHPADRDYLREVGKGNVSAGIRALIEFHKTHSDDD